MRIRTILPVAALLALVACGPSEAPPDPDAAAKLGPAEPLERSLPPASASPRYVGVWAVSEALCAQGAWTIREDGLSTAGEVSCTFNRVSEIPSGYEIAATCYAEGPPEPHTIQFAFAESAQALLVTGGPWAGPTGLVHCGASGAY